MAVAGEPGMTWKARKARSETMNNVIMRVIVLRRTYFIFSSLLALKVVCLFSGAAAAYCSAVKYTLDRSMTYRG